jgi:hypothetical protein
VLLEYRKIYNVCDNSDKWSFKVIFKKPYIKQRNMPFLDDIVKILCVFLCGWSVGLGCMQKSIQGFIYCVHYIGPIFNQNWSVLHKFLYNSLRTDFMMIHSTVLVLFYVYSSTEQLQKLFYWYMCVCLHLLNEKWVSGRLATCVRNFTMWTQFEEHMSSAMWRLAEVVHIYILLLVP